MSRRRLWRWIGAAGAILTVSAAVAACCGNPSSRYPDLHAPDRQCDIGWTDVWIWTCHAGQHVVIHRFRGEYGCDKPEKEVAACGAKTPFEEKYALQLEHCDPLPEAFRWH